MYHVWIAYLLWFIGGFGVLGLHRFYMKKHATAVLFILTGGVGFLGAAYDFLTMTRQIADVNERDGYTDSRRSLPAEVTIKREKEPLERAILRLAQANAGRVSPVQVAAASDWSVDQAQQHLDQMVRKGVCEMRIAKSGSVVYHFAELDPAANKDFEV